MSLNIILWQKFSKFQVCTVSERLHRNVKKFVLILFWLGGANSPLPSRFFLKNSVKRILWPWNFLTFCSYLSCNFSEISLKRFNKWGEGRQLSGIGLGNIAKSQISIIAKKVAEKVAKCQYFANFFRGVALFDVFYHNFDIWMEIVLLINLIAIFLIFANFAAFLDHTKENADVSKSDG